ncbi:MAG: hypothetical protein JNM31_08065 [Flavobacteriales bacterium]|nr:hypothetical protein [Flavobacteriales bacterium]
MRLPILLLVVLLMVACSPPEKEQEQLPTALQDPDVVQDIKGSLTSRGYSSDLVDALFIDVLKQDTSLQALLDAMDRQVTAHGDSTERLMRFEARNRSYYDAALAHTAQLSDSLEREQQRSILRQSEARYSEAMAATRDLVQLYDSLQRRTNELVELIKLKRTLVMMEKYQQQEPSADALMKAELERIKALEKRLEAALKR